MNKSVAVLLSGSGLMWPVNKTVSSLLSSLGLIWLVNKTVASSTVGFGTDLASEQDSISFTVMPLTRKNQLSFHQS